jgi:hypothetical protein
MSRLVILGASRPAGPGRQPGRLAWPRSGEEASTPRARARATAPLADRIWLVADAG